MGGTGMAGVVLGSRWQRGPVQQIFPLLCRQLSLAGHTKALAIILGTKIGEDWPEQSGQASRARGGNKQERQGWEKDRSSSEFPPNSLGAAWTDPSAARSPGRKSLLWPSNPPWLPGESSKARGSVAGRQSRAPPGSVCPASCHPASTALPRCRSRQVSLCAGGRASARMEGAVPSLHSPSRGHCRASWLPWQVWMVSRTRHCAEVARTHSGIIFYLRKAARLHSPPCASERKGMAIMGQAGNGSTPMGQCSPQQHRVNPSALILPKAGHRAEGLARTGLQHWSPGCRDALLWQQLGGHGFSDVGYKHPLLSQSSDPQHSGHGVGRAWGCGWQLR